MSKPSKSLLVALFSLVGLTLTVAVVAFCFSDNIGGPLHLQFIETFLLFSAFACAIFGLAYLFFRITDRKGSATYAKNI